MYKYFRHWSQKPSDDELSLLEQALKQCGWRGVRINHGRNEKTTFVIVDAQSVKNTDTAEQKGYDAGKKVSEGRLEKFKASLQNKETQLCPCA